MELTAELILAMWVGGMAGGAAVVAAWRVVGPGYTWLSAGVVALFGCATVLAGGGWPAAVGTIVAVCAGAAARRPTIAFAAMGVSAVAFLLVALDDSPAIPAASGLAFLGAVTTEMALGHWFLVDPKLPRWPLAALAAAAGAFLVADVAATLGGGSLPLSGGDAVFGYAYLLLSGFTALLLTGVWFSLREPRYSGVMAATGLSYLAVLTSFGVVTIGRAVLGGGLT